MREFANELRKSFMKLKLNGVYFANTFAKTNLYSPDRVTRKLVDQSMRDHIFTGLEAFLALYDFLQDQGMDLEEEDLQIAMIGYCLHDLHKSEAMSKDESSEYGLSPEELELVGAELCKDLNVPKLPARFFRVAGVSDYSNKLGDLSHLPGNRRWVPILNWIKLMDATASITSISECFLSGSALSLKKKLKKLLPPSCLNLKVEFHYIPEIRGTLTTQLHTLISEIYREQGYFPWLHFGDGTIYLAFQEVGEVTHELLEKELPRRLR